MIWGYPYFRKHPYSFYWNIVALQYFSWPYLGRTFGIVRVAYPLGAAWMSPAGQCQDPLSRTHQAPNVQGPLGTPSLDPHTGLGLPSSYIFNVLVMISPVFMVPTCFQWFNHHLTGEFVSFLIAKITMVHFHIILLTFTGQTTRLMCCPGILIISVDRKNPQDLCPRKCSWPKGRPVQKASAFGGGNPINGGSPKWFR